jgi:GNAT superfamily N-acetyltransferase
MRRNPMEYALGVSPLDYRPIGWDPGVIKRMSLVDPDAPPAPKGEFGFATTHQMEYTNPVTGRRWKKPRRLEILAPPAGTIAFLDYAIIGDPSTSDHAHAFIPYMKVRFDYQRRGLARQLVERFAEDCLRVGVKHLNFGKVLNETMWRIFEERKRAHEEGKSPMYVRGKRFF